MSFRLCSLPLFAWSLLLLSAQTSAAPPTEVSDKPEEIDSIVYYVGRIERITLGRAIIDLGDAHDVRIGNQLAVFRPTDNYFEPVGVVIADRCHPTWIVAAAAPGLTLEPDQLVVQIRSVAELSTGDKIRDRFLAHQKILNSQRNGYSTIRNLEAASALRDVQAQQPKWVNSRKQIAGVIQAPSQDEKMPQRTRNLLNQINQLRRLQSNGLPAFEAAGPQWQSVMSVLNTRPLPRDETTEELAQSTEPAVVQEQDTAPPAITEIRDVVQKRMFERNTQQQILATVFAASLLYGGVDNEQGWLTRETVVSQFPELQSDAPYIEDVMAVCNVIRGQQ
ncbi:MAG: hypothetical protein JNL58_26770 [Planctomyces sp.]|nr:hypothetical protein [Planctomyces sp.]